MKKEKLSEIGIPSKIEELKRLFPEYFDKEGRFLIEKFKEDIQNQTDISKETYSLEWLGKSYAKVLANEPVRTLLKENKEWNEKNNSQNVLIKGDNLEVLKHLVNAYERDIKMIYIDPPYNTGNDGFVYEDDRKFTPYKLSKLAGIDIEKAKRILDFVNSKSNSHSAWLTFMYPRLYIARRLLKDDGVIFVSIDDNEVAQLRILMDEIFGEENFVGEIIRKTKSTTADKKTGFNLQHENLLIYAKNIDNLFLKGEKKDYKDYQNPDNDPKGEWVSADPTAKSGNENLRFKIVNPYTGQIDLPPKGRYWAFSKESFEKYVETGKIKFKNEIKKGERGFIFKRYKKELKSEFNAVNSLFAIENEYMNQNATKELKSLLGNEYFENPKPVNYIKKLIKYSTSKSDLILDFFAGSGTTGDAVMQLNAEDGGSRKFILVQLPEPIDPKKSKTAYDFVKNELKKENPTIFDITKERLIRAAKKIQKEHKDKEWIDKLDLSFKEFETTPMPDENLKDIEELEEVDLFKEITDKNALLTTWKVFDGIKLHKDLKEMDFNGYKGYYLENKLYLVDSGFSLDNLAAILERIDKDNNFLPSKIVINGYVFDSKTQREIYESINNYNKKDLDKIELIVRY